MNPVGLTRFEEEQQKLPSKKAEPAPAGAQRCRITTLPEGTQCVAAAKVVIVWPDRDKTPACVDCANRMGQMAKSVHSSIAVEAL